MIWFPQPLYTRRGQHWMYFRPKVVTEVWYLPRPSDRFKFLRECRRSSLPNISHLVRLLLASPRTRHCHLSFPQSLHAIKTNFDTKTIWSLLSFLNVSVFSLFDPFRTIPTKKKVMNTMTLRPRRNILISRRPRRNSFSTEWP